MKLLKTTAKLTGLLVLPGGVLFVIAYLVQHRHEQASSPPPWKRHAGTTQTQRWN